MDDTQVYARRRAELARRIGAAGGGLAVVPTAPARRRNGSDNDHPFRAGSHFHYLTGFGEPDAWLVLDGSGACALMLRPRDAARELWDGARLGVDAAPASLGVDAAFDVAQLNPRIVERLAGQPALWTLFGADDTQAPAIERWLAAARAKGGDGPAAHRDLAPLLDEMRLRKDAAEVDAMRRAGAIGAAAHVRAMRACRPGLREYELEAELLHEFRRSGAAGPAYESIVAAGANACVLHHPAGDAELRAGELCLIDAGCEWRGYASDITRTFPVSGRFSAPQRELYALVLTAQQAALAETRPGARKQDAHWAAARTIAQGLLDLRLLDANAVGTLDDVIEKAAYRRFFMHGTGHWLGLDVHDVGEYLALDEPALDQRDGAGGRTVRRPSRRLEPGMVVTVEPGVYVQPAADVDERWWNIGIRIEDDALVTDDGHELLSRGAPVAIDDIEAVMRA
jgi:Xaa-Pro aminopeptidase